MTKKYGPLPLWAWGLAGIITIYLFYRSQSASGTSSTAAQQAAQGIDPNTGVPYSQEESAYLSSLSPGTQTSSGSGGDTTGAGAGGAYDLNSFLTTLAGLEAAGVNFGTTAPTPMPAPVGPTPPAPAPGAPAPAPAPAPSNGTTTPGTGGSPGTNTQVGQRLSTGALLVANAILAPFGSRTTKQGYVTVGTGGGNYQYVPVNIAPRGFTLFHTISGTNPAPRIARGLGHGLWAVPANYYRTGGIG